jgi:hypothetical protein
MTMIFPAYNGIQSSLEVGEPGYFHCLEILGRNVSDILQEVQNSYQKIELSAAFEMESVIMNKNRISV